MFSWNVILFVGVSFIVARWIPFLAWKELQRRTDVALSPLHGKCGQKEICVISMPQRGCRSCHKKLFSTCVAVQVVAASAAGVMGYTVADLVKAAIGVVLIWVLLLLSLTDLWAGLIPNRFTYTGILLFATWRGFVQPQRFVQYAFAFMLTLIGMMVVSWITRGLGGGDVKLLAMSAWLIGGPQVLVAFFLATAIGTGYVGWRWMRHRPIRPGEPFPFAPHLACGIFIAYIWGDGLLDWYWTGLNGMEWLTFTRVSSIFSMST
jgi:prepilin signal peptidase PulO-like enzyme (type II secretory pathway)